MSHTLELIAKRALVLSTLLLLIASAAPAQSRGTKPIYPVKFKPNSKTATVEGTVTEPSGEGDMRNPGSERYSLAVREGQTVSLEISSDNGDAVFSLAASNFEIVKQAGGVKRWSGKLKAAGDYIITVFTQKKRSHFKLRVTLR